MGRITETVKYIIIINVVLWIATIALYQSQIMDLNSLLAFHYPGSPLYKPWQFLTHMFMHASVGHTGIVIAHILFNMFGVWMFGTPLEQMWGRNKFIFFYISAGLGAVMLQLGFYYFQYQSGMDAFMEAGYTIPQVQELLSSLGDVNVLDPSLRVIGEEMQSVFYGSMLGASGALYGILVAYAFSFPNSELMMIFLPIPIKAKYFVPLMIVGDLFFGFSRAGTGIAHFAHVGGAVAGFIMMWYWKKNSFNKNRWN